MPAGGESQQNRVISTPIVRVQNFNVVHNITSISHNMDAYHSFSEDDLKEEHDDLQDRITMETEDPQQNDLLVCRSTLLLFYR